MIEEILLRLPARVLVKFSTISKPWNQLIFNVTFRERHFDATVRNMKIDASAFFLAWTQTGSSSPKLSALRIQEYDSDSCTDERRVHRRIRCSIEEAGLPEVITKSGVIVLSCRGVLCTVETKGSRNVALSNPALREFWMLPEATYDGKPVEVVEFIGVGFGYDSERGDHKIVRIYTSPNPIEIKAQTFSVKTGSWKPVSVDSLQLYQSLGVQQTGVHYNGAHYWLDIAMEFKELEDDDFELNNAVAVFDYSKEEFHVVSLPDFASEFPYGLATWNESLALFTVDTDVLGYSAHEIWILVDGPDGETSWSRLLRIAPIDNLYSPREFWKDSELLMTSNDGKTVNSFNIDTEEFRTIGQDFYETQFLFERHTESLVSEGRAKASRR